MGLCYNLQSSLHHFTCTVIIYFTIIKGVRILLLETKSNTNSLSPIVNQKQIKWNKKQIEYE